MVFGEEIILIFLRKEISVLEIVKKTKPKLTGQKPTLGGFCSLDSHRFQWQHFILPFPPYFCPFSQTPFRKWQKSEGVTADNVDWVELSSQHTLGP